MVIVPAVSVSCDWSDVPVDGWVRTLPLLKDKVSTVKSWAVSVLLSMEMVGTVWAVLNVTELFVMEIEGTVTGPLNVTYPFVIVIGG